MGSNWLWRTLHSAGRQWFYDKAVRRPPKLGAPGAIHFLHIGKCAGSQVNHIARQINEKLGTRKIIKQSHEITLLDLDPEDSYFFSIRNPVTRFKSGFYSRKRKGQPKNFSEWTLHEQRAFADFEHANDLAESLFEEGAVGNRAFAAIKSISHTAQNQSDWFCQTGHFLDLRPPVWIIRQEHFANDMDVFLARAGLAAVARSVTSTADPVSSHANDYSGVPDFSEKALANLRRWYEQDFALYSLCEDWMMRHSAGG